MKKLLFAVLITVLSFNVPFAQGGMLMPSSWPNTTTPQVLPIPEDWAFPKIHYDYVMPEFTEHLSILRKCFGAEEGIVRVLVDQDSILFKWDENAITCSYTKGNVVFTRAITPIDFGAVDFIEESDNLVVVVVDPNSRESVLSEFQLFFEKIGCVQTRIETKKEKKKF
jgi:hypothetical protein